MLQGLGIAACGGNGLCHRSFQRLTFQLLRFLSGFQVLVLFDVYGIFEIEMS
jgi:hypothetical protein